MTPESRGGVSSWCLLPDDEAATSAARLLCTRTRIAVHHASGRPWLFFAPGVSAVRLFSAGVVRAALIGACLADDRQVEAMVEHAVARGDFDVLTTLAGCYHLVVSDSTGVVVYGDVAGLRRVFIARHGGTIVAASHANVLQTLIGAAVDRVWVAGRLGAPEMPTALRESRSPFEDVRPLPPGRRLTVTGGSYQCAPYWQPPEAEASLGDGAPVLRDAMARAVSGRARRAGGLVSVQLSGGLDSTALACLAADITSPMLITTASGSRANDDLDWARTVAAHLSDVEHRVVSADEVPTFFAGLPAAVGAWDEPAPFTAGAARLAHVAALLTERGTTLHLNGQGGDEVLLAPLAYLGDVLRTAPTTGWRHVRGQAALRNLPSVALARHALREESYPRWLYRAVRSLHRKVPAAEDAVGWETAPLLPPWATTDAAELVRDALLDTDLAHCGTAPRSTHAALTRIRASACRAGLYREAMATAGVPVEFPFLDRAVIDACLAVRPWERTDPWQPKPLLRAALADVARAGVLSRRTKGHYNDDIYRGWKTHRHQVTALLDRPLLGEWGLIDTTALHRSLSSFGQLTLPPVFLTDTLAIELWLQTMTTRDQGR